MSDSAIRGHAGFAITYKGATQPNKNAQFPEDERVRIEKLVEALRGELSRQLRRGVVSARFSAAREASVGHLGNQQKGPRASAYCKQHGCNSPCTKGTRGERHPVLTKQPQKHRARDPSGPVSLQSWHSRPRPAQDLGNIWAFRARAAQDLDTPNILRPIQPRISTILSFSGPSGPGAWKSWCSSACAGQLLALLAFLRLAAPGS